MNLTTQQRRKLAAVIDGFANVGIVLACDPETVEWDSFLDIGLAAVKTKLVADARRNARAAEENYVPSKDDPVAIGQLSETALGRRRIDAKREAARIARDCFGYETAAGRQ